MNRVVHQPVVRLAQARAHLVEGGGDGDRFGAAAQRQAHRQVAGCHRRRGGGDIAQRPAQVPAEGQAQGQADRENGGAAGDEPGLQAIDEVLARLPVGQQDQPSRAGGAHAGRQGEGAHDVTPLADVQQVGSDHRRRASRLTDLGPVGALGAGQAGRHHLAAPDERDVGLQDAGGIADDAVGQRVAHRERAEHFVGEHGRVLTSSTSAVGVGTRAVAGRPWRAEAIASSSSIGAIADGPAQPGLASQVPSALVTTANDASRSVR